MKVKETLSIFFPEQGGVGLENKLNRQEYTYHQTSLRQTYEKKKENCENNHVVTEIE